MVPVRAAGWGLSVNEKNTLLRPEPVALVTIIQSALLCAAHPQPSSARTSKPPVPPLALNDAPVGVTGEDKLHAVTRRIRLLPESEIGRASCRERGKVSVG